MWDICWRLNAAHFGLRPRKCCAETLPASAGHLPPRRQRDTNSLTRWHACASERHGETAAHHCAVSSLLVGLMLMSPYDLGCSSST